MMSKSLLSCALLATTLVVGACGNAVDRKPLSNSGKPRIYDVSVFSSSHFTNFEQQHGENWFDHIMAYAERCTVPAFGDGARVLYISSADGFDYLFLRPGASANNEDLTKEDIVFRMILGVNRGSKYVADLGVPGAPGVVAAEQLGRRIAGLFSRNRPLQPLTDCPRPA